MNSTDPTNAQFAAYRAIWVCFNTVLFGGALGDMILLQDAAHDPDARAQVLGSIYVCFRG